MSEPKLISPMLDNYEMGGPISDHDGVRCCPAMRKDSDDKYIVKIISVPASQSKLDALLLTGACSDVSSALLYFKDQADGIIKEKKILDNLANLEGFISYDDSQIVPMDDDNGFDVYLLSQYRMTLERNNLKKPMTQLAAVNLGLDLCTALDVCRRSGYMFVDLKPSNIYVTGDKEFKIGDIGFVRLNSLKYESLPDKYRSRYTAPEVEDAFAPLNTTMDIYAVGLILYQVFNTGRLPFSGDQALDAAFDPPACADEEMSQIILKACHPDPAERWQDPVEMGQAIVNYMQKNGVNDTPLTLESFGRIPAKTAEEENTDATEAVSLTEISDATVSISDAIANVTEENEALEDETADTDSIISELSVPDEAPVEETPAENDAADVKPVNQAAETEDYEQILSIVGHDYDGISDEASEILGQIDELTAMKVPDPVVAPEPIEIKIPDPIVLEDAQEESDETETSAEVHLDFSDTDEIIQDIDSDVTEETDDEIDESDMPYVPKKKRTGLIWGIVIAVLLAIAAGSYFFYTMYYLQPVQALTLDGHEDKLHVTISSEIEDALLTVICADSHGNNIPAPVVNGTAVFSGLTPDEAYTVSLEIDGFHQLTGITSKVYSTPVQTKIPQMNVITGSESGSVILSFTVDGPDSEQWNVIYSAADEAERVTAFPAHMVTLTGLTVGKEYTFRIEPVEDIYLTGTNEITYTAKDIVCAENLQVTACADGVLTAQWNTPDGETVTQWSVRCYNDSGFDETITTAENFVTFQNIDDTSAYTVEVTAADMSVNQRVLVPANSVTITDFKVDNSSADILKLSWKSNREVPESGWTLRYSINGISAPATITVSSHSTVIPVVLPGEYVFALVDESGNLVLGGPFTHSQGNSPEFSGFSVKQADLTMRLCKTPAASGWSYRDLKEEDYMNSFEASQKISTVIAHSGEVEKSDKSVSITFAIYNENGDLISFTSLSQSWNAMWHESYCELDIPTTPSEPGTYTVKLLFNGALAGSQKFAITD